MLIAFYIVLNFMVIVVSTEYAPWNSGYTVNSSPMPRSVAMAAIGYDEYNERIWIIGGLEKEQQLMSFDTHSFNFTDHGLHHFSQPIRTGYSTYSQLGNILYIVDSVSRSVNAMMMESGSLQSNIASVPQTSDVGCISAFTLRYDYLLITISSGDIFIFNITGNSWIELSSELRISRTHHGCAVVDQTFYIFAGIHGNDSSPTWIPKAPVIALDVSHISNIQNKRWKTIGNLTFPRYWHSSITYGYDILIMSGFFDADWCVDILRIDVINTIQNTISFGGQLKVPAPLGSPIIAYPWMYLFGGFDCANEMEQNTWQYHVLNNQSQIHQYMSPRNIYPSPTYLEQGTIHIRSSIQDTDENISYFAKFIILKNNCINPTIDVVYQDTDFDGVDGVEFLDIYYKGSIIANCGSNNNTCHESKYCLKDYSIPNIPKNTEIIIQLDKGKDSGILSGCLYSLSANVTLKCHTTSSPSASPITTTPTNNPSIYPTALPTKIPTRIPTRIPTTNPTMKPTLQPTVDPTMNPTRIPSYLPTMIPTNVPTIIPSRITSTHPTITPSMNISNVSPTLEPNVDPTMRPIGNPTMITTQHSALLSIASDSTIFSSSDSTSNPIVGHKTESNGITIPLILILLLSIAIGIGCWIWKRKFIIIKKCVNKNAGNHIRKNVSESVTELSRLTKPEEKTITNALVLSICIGNYLDDRYVRTGCDKDVENIYKTFGANGWGFEVIPPNPDTYPYMNEKQCIKLLENAQRKIFTSHDQYDGLFCFVSAHGMQYKHNPDETIICLSPEKRGLPWGKISVGDIIAKFKNNEKEIGLGTAFLEKPKIFVIHACRDEQIKIDDIDIKVENNGSRNTHQPDADILTLQSNVSGHSSFRNENKGSYLIAVATEELQHLQNGNKISLDQKFLNIKRKVQKLSKDQMVPELQNRFGYEVYLHKIDGSVYVEESVNEDHWDGKLDPNEELDIHHTIGNKEESVVATLAIGQIIILRKVQNDEEYLRLQPNEIESVGKVYYKKQNWTERKVRGFQVEYQKLNESGVFDIYNLYSKKANIYHDEFVEFQNNKS